MGDPALSFGQAAAHYDRIRPSYPAEAIRRALGDPPARVVDLGAGTGLLTRVLLAEGFDVVPVEPEHRVTDLGPQFGQVQRAEFRHATLHTGDTLVDLIRSRSYYLTATAPGREQIESAVRRVVADIGRDTLELPYVTEVYWAFRTSPTSA